MTVDRTELEWTYEPTDFFEAPYSHAEPDFELKIDGGNAIATLAGPGSTPPADAEGRVRSFVKSLFLARELQLHRGHKLEGPRISRYSGSHKNVELEVAGSVLTLTGGRVDFTVHDAAGNLVRDSKAERIAADTSLLELLAPKIQQSAMLRSLFESYSSAVSDPDDEFTHLYEIRDALSSHYSNEENTCRALGISKRDWSRFGYLTNAADVDQSRHRGKHLQGRRPATNDELDEARDLVRQWIVAFARTL
jgi:hypothetical protein